MENHLYECLYDVLRSNALATDKKLRAPQRYKAKLVELVRNLMAHAQKLDFVFRLNGRVHLNRRGSQFSRLLAAECAHQR